MPRDSAKLYLIVVKLPDNIQITVKSFIGLSIVYFIGGFALLAGLL